MTKKPSLKPTARSGILHIVLDSWQRKIVFDGGARTLNHTRTEYQYQAPQVATPSSWTTVVIAKDLTLTSCDLDILATAVDVSGILALTSEVYGAREHERSYPYSIELKLADETTKRVRWNSNPDYTPPAEFVRLEGFLENFATKVESR